MTGAAKNLGGHPPREHRHPTAAAGDVESSSTSSLGATRRVRGAYVNPQSGISPAREHLLGMAFGPSGVRILEIPPGHRVHGLDAVTTDHVDPALKFLPRHDVEPYCGTRL
jgi:hypothetical protein